MQLNITSGCLHIGIDFLKNGSVAPRSVRSASNHFNCIFLVWEGRTFETIRTLTRFVIPKLKTKTEFSITTCFAALFEGNSSP